MTTSPKGASVLLVTTSNQVTILPSVIHYPPSQIIITPLCEIAIIIIIYSVNPRLRLEYIRVRIFWFRSPRIATRFVPCSLLSSEHRVADNMQCLADVLA